MSIEILTKEDFRELLREELPGILKMYLPKTDEQPATTEEICNYFDISESTLKRYRIKGKIDYVKIGRQYRYIKSEVKAALTKRKLV